MKNASITSQLTLVKQTISRLTDQNDRLPVGHQKSSIAKTIIGG